MSGIKSNSGGITPMQMQLAQLTDVISKDVVAKLERVTNKGGFRYIVISASVIPENLETGIFNTLNECLSYIREDVSGSRMGKIFVAKNPETIFNIEDIVLSRTRYVNGDLGAPEFDWSNLEIAFEDGMYWKGSFNKKPILTIDGNGSNPKLVGSYIYSYDENTKSFQFGTSEDLTDVSVGDLLCLSNFIFYKISNVDNINKTITIDPDYNDYDNSAEYNNIITNAFSISGVVSKIFTNIKITANFTSMKLDGDFEDYDKRAIAIIASEVEVDGNIDKFKVNNEPEDIYGMFYSGLEEEYNNIFTGDVDELLGMLSIMSKVSVKNIKNIKSKYISAAGLAAYGSDITFNNIEKISTEFQYTDYIAAYTGNSIVNGKSIKDISTIGNGPGDAILGMSRSIVNINSISNLKINFLDSDAFSIQAMYTTFNCNIIRNCKSGANLIKSIISNINIKEIKDCIREENYNQVSGFIINAKNNSTINIDTIKDCENRSEGLIPENDIYGGAIYCEDSAINFNTISNIKSTSNGFAIGSLKSNIIGNLLENCNVYKYLENIDGVIYSKESNINIKEIKDCVNYAKKYIIDLDKSIINIDKISDMSMGIMPSDIISQNNTRIDNLGILDVDNLEYEIYPATTTSKTLTLIKYLNNMYIAIGGSGAGSGLIMSSDNNLDYSDVTPAGINDLYDIAYGNGIYVAIGNTGAIATSLDGITWTVRTSGTITERLNKIIFSDNGYFVIVANSGKIYTSTDGLTWTSQTSGTTESLNDIIYNNTRFIIVGSNGIILTADITPITWTIQTSNTALGILKIKFLNNLYMGIGYTGNLVTSPDGITWTVRTTSSTKTLYDIVYGNGLYVIVGQDRHIESSPDGITWTVRNANVGAIFYYIIFDGTKFITHEGNKLYVSTDAITWNSTDYYMTAKPSQFAYSQASYIGYVNNTYMGVGIYGRIVKSTNLLDWLNIGIDGIDSLTIIYVNNKYYLHGPRGGLAVSEDRKHWQYIKTAYYNTSSGVQFLKYINNKFIVGTNVGDILVSTDFKSWNAYNTGTVNTISNISYANGLYIFIYASGGSYRVSSDLMNWSSVSYTTSDPSAGFGANSPIIYFKGKYYNIGGYGPFAWLFSSEDLTYWTKLSETYPFSIEYASDDIMILKSGTKIYYTEDGTNLIETFTASVAITKIIYNEYLKVYIGGSNSGIIFRSTDGKTWVEINLNSTVGMAAIYQYKNIIAICDTSPTSGYTPLISFDGVTFNIMPSPSGVFSSYVVNEYGILIYTSGATSPRFFDFLKNKYNRYTDYNLNNYNYSNVLPKQTIDPTENDHLVRKENLDTLESDMNTIINNYKIDMRLNNIDRFYDKYNIDISPGDDIQDAIYINGIYIVLVENDFFVSNNGTTWKKIYSNQNNILTKIIYDSNKFIVIGDAGTILTSSDGITWTARTSGVVYDLNDIIRAQVLNMFIITGDNGTILTSSDGITWTARTSGTIQTLTSIAYGSSEVQKLVIVGYNGTILTSPDGITWTSRTSGTTNPLTKIIYGYSGNYYTVGWSGILLTSPDGITWTARTSNIPTNINDIFYSSASTVIVIVGSLGEISTSSDGTTWIPRTSGTTASLKNIKYYNNTLYICGASGKLLLSSNNGNSWSSINTNTTTTLTTMIYAGILYIMGIGVIIQYLDGMCRSLMNINKLLKINDNMVIGIGNNGDVIKIDNNYNIINNNMYAGTTFNDICYGNNLLVAVGAGGKISTSPDGINWTARTSGTIQTLTIVKYLNNLYLAAGGDNTLLTSPDGITWTIRTIPGSINTFTDIVYFKGYYIASNLSKFVSSPDGITWNIIYSTPTRKIYMNNNTIIVVGDQIYTSEDGITWASRYSSESTVNILGINDIIIAISYNGHILRSTDNGVTWNNIGFSINPALFTNIFNIYNRFVILNSYYSIYISDDGINWVDRNIYNKTTTGLKSIIEFNNNIILGGRLLSYSTF